MTVPANPRVLGSPFGDFLGRCGGVQLEVLCTDRLVDVVEESFDLAIRGRTVRLDAYRQESRRHSIHSGRQPTVQYIHQAHLLIEQSDRHMDHYPQWVERVQSGARALRARLPASEQGRIDAVIKDRSRSIRSSDASSYPRSVGRISLWWYGKTECSPRRRRRVELAADEWHGRLLSERGHVVVPKPRPPRLRQSITPSQFEAYVARYLRRVAAFTRQKCKVVEQGRVRGAGGEYAIDVLVRFGALGFDFVMLVECKHHREPVKRKDIQALLATMRDVQAQKAVLFSTSGFQSGAIEFAAQYSIALVHCQPNTEPRIVISGDSDFGAEGELVPRLNDPVEWAFYWHGGCLSAEHWQSMETLAAAPD